MATKRQRIEIPKNQEELKISAAARKQERLKKACADYRRITKAGIAGWVQDFKAQRSPSVSDLRHLIELDIELLEKE